MRVAERDAVWTRDGLPIEELPDPFTQPTPSPEMAQQQHLPSRRRRWPLVLYSIAAVIFPGSGHHLVKASGRAALSP